MSDKYKALWPSWSSENQSSGHTEISLRRDSMGIIVKGYHEIRFLRHSSIV